MISTTINEQTWAVACTGAYGVPAMSGSRLTGEVWPVSGGAPSPALAVRPRHTAVRHVASTQRMQGRSVFTAAPISQQAQAHRLDVVAIDRFVERTTNDKDVLMNDYVVGPSPWRPPPV
ncbi:MAG TPA: hypothetical protein VH912_17760 [Streptosporangiaceae bacterium]